MLKGIWEALSPDIRNIINDAGFGTFFEALLNQETREYKHFQLLLALSNRFLDTMCTFHVSGISEVMFVRIYVEHVKNICHIKLAYPLTKRTLLVIG